MIRNPSLTLYMLRLLFTPLLLVVFTPTQADTPSAQQSAKWREIVVPTGSFLRQAFWCGITSDLIIVEGGADPQGKEPLREVITLVNLVKTSKEKVTIGQKYRFWNCSQDGRLLFYDEITPRETLGGLHAYDRASKRFALVLPEAYRTYKTRLAEPLSPDGRVMLAKSGTPLKQVSLPDGRTVEVIPSPNFKRYNLLGWVLDGYKLEISQSAGNFLNGMAKSERLIFDLRSGSSQALNLDRNSGQSHVTYSIWSRDRQSIYFLSMRPTPGRVQLTEEDLQFDLYRKDYSGNDRARLLVEHVNQFDVAPNGEIVFNHHEVYEKRPGLYLADPGGKNVRRLTTGLDVEPKFSGDGTMIKFARAPKANRSDMTYTESFYNSHEATLRVLIRQ